MFHLRQWAEGGICISGTFLFLFSRQWWGWISPNIFVRLFSVLIKGVMFMYLLFSCKYVVYQYSDLWTPLSRCGTCRSGTCLSVCIGSWKRQVCLWSVPLLSVIPTFHACYCDCLLKERYKIAVMCKAQGVLWVISKVSAALVSAVFLLKCCRFAPQQPVALWEM